MENLLMIADIFNYKVMNTKPLLLRWNNFMYFVYEKGVL